MAELQQPSPEKVLDFVDKKEKSFFENVWSKRPENAGKPTEELKQIFLSRRKTISDGIKAKQKDSVAMEIRDGMLTPVISPAELNSMAKERFVEVVA
jgi:hypothetical protein